MESTSHRFSNPFPGLRPFHSDEHHLFFGREEQTTALLQLLRTKHFLAVVGTSGSGKSSLVRAGMIAELYGGTMTQAGSTWEVILLRPGGSPIENLARSMVEAGLYDAEDPSTLPRLLATLNRSRFGLAEAMKQSVVVEPGTNLLVVVDQFEELFRFRQQGVDSEEAAAAFVNLLLTASAQSECPIYVTITMRSDYLGECSEIPGLAEAVNEGEYLIPRLQRDQKRDAIEKPIGVGGATISPLLVQRLLNEIGDDSDQLPVLQHSLMRMWDAWSAGSDHGRPIDIGDFEATGGLATALSNHADEIYDTLPDDHHKAVCEKIFKTLTEKGNDNRGIRRPTRLAHLQAIAVSDRFTVTNVLDAFRRPGVTFLMPGSDVELSDRSVVDLSHESLMRGWQRLRGWVEEEAQSARIFRRLADTARLWSDGKAGLFRGPDLQIALSWREQQVPNREWAEQYGGDFDAAMRFLETSNAEAQAERLAREEARKRELVQAQELAESRQQRLMQQQRSAHRLRIMIGGLAVVAAIAVITSIVAGQFWQEATVAKQHAETSEEQAKKNATTAQEEADRAKEQKQLAESNRAKAEKAEKLATEEQQRADNAAEFARQNLYYAQMHLTPQLWRGGHRSLLYMRERLASWRPEGESRDRRGWEWFYLNSLPFQNHRDLTEAGHDDDGNSAVAWHVAGKRLAEGTSQGVIRIWDVDREKTTLILRGPRPWVQYWGGRWFGWSPDGRQIAAGFSDATVHVWDTQTGRELRVLRGHSAQILSVAYNSDGTRVAAWGLDGAVKIWDTKSGQLMEEVAHPGGVGAGAWSPDDKQIACGHGNGTVTISGTRRGDQVTTLGGGFSPITGLSWSPDSTRVAATSSFDYSARIWDVASGKVVVGPLRHTHEVTSVAWEPNGQRLATGSIDETIKLWDQGTGREVVTLRGHAHTVTSLSWGPDGRLASSSNDGSLKIWAPIRDQESNVLSGHAGRAHSVSWSPNGKQLASGGDDGKIRIWDAATRKEVQVLLGHDPSRVSGQYGLIRSLSWSPDSRQLASAGLDGAAKVWDVASGREVFALPAGAGAVWTVKWNPNGKQLAAGYQGGTIRVVTGLPNAPNVSVIQAHETNQFGAARSLAWNPRGDRLASGGLDGLVKVWDPLRGVELVRMQEQQTLVFSVAWSPDGNQLATASGDCVVTTWNAQTGQKLATMRGHHSWVEGVAWSPDGTRLASAGGDNSVRVWDPRTGEETFLLRGSSGMFHDVAWHPEGAQLAAANDDGQVWFWDATHGYERDTTRRALPFIDRLITSGTARGDDLRWCSEAYLRAGRFKDALAVVKDDPLKLSKMARQIADTGNMAIAHEAMSRARILLEQQLAAEPNNAAAASELANLLLTDTTVWTILKPSEVKSNAGATLTLHPDGSILASGVNATADIYTLSVGTDLNRIAAIRLEALPDPSLPKGGPGRHASGNFQLSAFRLHRVPTDGTREFTRVPLASAWASFDYKAFDADIAGTLDESLKKVWHVFGRPNEAHQAIFLLQKPVAAGHGQSFLIELRHRDHDEPLNLGRFRVSVTPDEVTPGRLRKRLAALRLTNSWVRLAAAYQHLGEVQKLDGLIKKHSLAATAPGDLAAAEADWDGAIAEYGKVITHPKVGGLALVKRAQAYEATQRWGLAKADWERAAPTRPELVFARARRLVESGVAAFESGQRAVAIRDLQQGRDLLQALHRAFPEDGRMASQLGISLGFLGSTLRDEQRPDEARASFGASRKVLETIPQKTALDHYNLACAYANLSVLKAPGQSSPNVAESQALTDRAMDSLQRSISAGMTDLNVIETDHDLDPLRSRPDFRNLMLAQLAKASAAKPKDTLLCLKVAALQAWFGQQTELAVTRQRILAVAANTQDAREADCAAKVCCILPNANKAELEKAVALGRKAVEFGKGSELLPWFHLALGMAEYRIGNDAAAEQALRAAAQAEQSNPHAAITSSFFRAMSLFRQGKKDEARLLATGAAAKMTPLPKDDSNPMAHGASHDDLILWLAYKEAKAMIKFEPPITPNRESDKK